MLGGDPVKPGPPESRNETFTVHATKLKSYEKCTATGAPAQWTVTREVTYLDGTATGRCQIKLLEGGNVIGKRTLGTFEHNCTVMTQITIAADTNGDAQCLGCRCCNSCVPAALCLPP